MPGKVPRRSLDIDPLAQAIAPASDETFDEKAARVSAEREAKRVSDAIDEELDRQRQVQRRAPKHVKVLLLGTLPHIPLRISLTIRFSRSE